VTAPTARPSIHPRHTKAWAIDQADPDRLRDVAHALLAALSAAQWQTVHAVGAHAGQCTPCSYALDRGEDLGCPEWLDRQAVIDAGWRCL
jgi:hypothetical protein